MFTARYRCTRCRTPMSAPEHLAGRTEVCKMCGAMNIVPISRWRRFFRFDEESQLTTKVVIGLVALSLAIYAICKLASEVERTGQEALRARYDTSQAEKSALAAENAELRDDKAELTDQFKNERLRLAAVEAEQSRLRAQLGELQANLAKPPEPPPTPAARPVPPPPPATPSTPAAPAVAVRTPPKAPPRTAPAATIPEAVARGVAYLKTLQGDDGGFAGSYQSTYPDGETALALLALRYAGVGLTDPACERGAKLLLAGQSDQTYVNSLIAQVLALAPAEHRPALTRRRLNQLAQFLASSQLDDGTWTYGPPLHSAHGRPVLVNPLAGDNSNTQFALLGLWKLAEAGAEFDRRTLRLCESHFLETQHPDGGWGYKEAAPRTPAGALRPASSAPSMPAMTATGLATLHVLTDLLHLHDEGAFAAGYAPNCGRPAALDQALDAAMDRAEADLEAFVNPRGLPRDSCPINMYTLYYLYSVERVGAASGRKYFGAVDWYAAIARLLLAGQNADGSWGLGRHDAVETSLALLFLAKGRAPVFFEKLRYDGDWRNDPRDVAHVTAYAARELEQHLNWQVIDLKSNVDGWFDAPVLFFNGHDGPAFTDDEKQKLQDYVARGGFLFAEACCSRPRFAAAVRQLGRQLWPDLEWKTLPADHPLYTRQSHFDLKNAPPLEGLTDAKGFTFFVLAPRDVSCLWNQNLVDSHEDAFHLALNVHRYASQGQPIRSRLSP